MSGVTESQVIPIANTKKTDRVGDVIFVHGLNGNGKQYWVKGDDPTKFWPQWVGDDLENIGVWSISYPASAFAWQGATMSLDKRAGNVINLLQTNDLATQRPVVFITHSLGGLLVKQMLRSAKDKTVANAQSLIEQTKGIVFIATPHDGANLADFVERFGSILQPTELVNILKKEQPNLLSLNTWFRNNFDDLNIQVQAFCEQKATPLNKKDWLGKLISEVVVDCNSADPKLPGVNVVSLDKDHIGICQLEDRNEQLYKNILPFIEQCLLVDDNNGDISVKPQPTGLSDEEMIGFINSNLNNLTPDRLQTFFLTKADVSLDQIAPNGERKGKRVNDYLEWVQSGEGYGLQEAYNKVSEFVKKK